MIPWFFLKVKVKVKSLSRVQLFMTPWTVAYQAPPFLGFSRQEYWSGLPLPSPGIEPRSPALWADALTSEPPGETPCKTETVAINQQIPILPFPAPAITIFAFCLYEFDECRYLLYVKSCCIDLFVTGLFHLAQCLQGLLMLEQVSTISHFSSWKNRQP